MEESNVEAKEINENASLNFYPTIERLINQQKTIVCRIQEYVIYETEESDKTPSSEVVTPSVKLWREVLTLRALTKISLDEQKVKKASIKNLTLTEGDR